MIIIWGRKRVERSLGWVADFCPICREIRGFEVFRVGMAGHVYYISAGEGRLLGYVKRCKQCGVRLGADAEQYNGFDKDTSDHIDALIHYSFPKIREKFASRLVLEEQVRKNPGAIPQETRRSLLMEPFVLFNGMVETSAGGNVRLDAESALAGLGTFFLSGLLFFMGAGDGGSDNILLAASVVLFSGIAFTLLQLFLRPRRHVRRKVLPFLAQALKPLGPARSELVECRDKCVSMHMKIGYAIKPEQLLEEMRQSASERAGFLGRRPTVTAELIGIAVATIVILVVCRRPGAEAQPLKVQARTEAPPAVVAPVPVVAPPVSPSQVQKVATRQEEAVPQVVKLANSTVVFIQVAKRTDMVHDAKRNLLYIAAGDTVLRYRVDSQSFLPPLKLGGELRGMDISADGKLLAVADASAKGGQVGFHLVNLESGADSPVAFKPVGDEAGTFSIVFDANGCIWTTSTFRNSGGLWPLRRYNPATRETAIISKVGQDTMLTTSADRKFIAYADGYATPSTYGRFSCDAATLPPPSHALMSLYEVGISRDGTQLALPSYTGVILSGAGSEKLDLREALGAAYHPSRDYVFVVRADGTKVTVLETAHYTTVKELELGAKFGWIGNHPFQEGRLRLSSDGKYVFCTAPGGIRYAETGLF